MPVHISQKTIQIIKNKITDKNLNLNLPFLRLVEDIGNLAM
jgi:hypothetical protein